MMNDGKFYLATQVVHRKLDLQRVLDYIASKHPHADVSTWSETDVVRVLDDFTESEKQEKISVQRPQTCLEDREERKIEKARQPWRVSVTQ